MPPIAFIIPISRRCSPISVVIVFAISTSPASSASTVNTFMIEASWSKRSLPGYDPGLRSSGRFEKPVKDVFAFR